MMMKETERRVSVRADNLQTAVEQMLSYVLLTDDSSVGPEALTEATISRQPKSFLLGYGGEAGDIPTLITYGLEEINALAAEQNATVVACEVSGLRPTGEGHRIWGTIECITSPNGPGQSTRVDAITYEHPEPRLWHLTAHIIDKEPT